MNKRKFDTFSEPVEWFAHEIVDNIGFRHSIRVLNEEHDMGGGRKEIDDLVEIVFENSVSKDAEDNDMRLDDMNMLHWRQVCDKILELVLKENVYDVDSYDWPTPKPHVTMVADDQDVMETVTIVFRVDHDTFNAVKKSVENFGNRMCVEWCPECDHEFKYRYDESKLVAICPKCGAIVALCNECKKHLKEGCVPGTCEALSVAAKIIPASMCK